jgi:FkbM family methyltransferase
MPSEARRGFCISCALGYRINLERSDYIQRSIYLGTFEPVESAQVKSYLKKGMTFVDVGANVGYYTLLAASLVGSSGRIIAFEPSPYAFRKLEETVRENSIPQIDAVPSGLGEVACERQLFMPTRNGNHTPSMVPNDGGRPLSVQVRRLDDYLDEQAIDRVDLMKIDVEGLEPNVIRGARKHIERGHIHAILCEFNQDWLAANNSSVAGLYEQLVSFGYKSTTGPPKAETQVQNIFFTLG